MSGASTKPLDPEIRKVVEQMMKEGLTLTQISEKAHTTRGRLRRLYPNYLSKTKANTLNNKRAISAKTLSRLEGRINPLYDPARDGVVRFPSLTSKLLGDPPPGRRELLESWARNSKSRSTQVSEEA